VGIILPAGEFYLSSYDGNSPGHGGGGGTAAPGAGWNAGCCAGAFRTTVRSGVHQDRRNNNIGLRCVQAP
jgi:hypothetical protein